GTDHGLAQAQPEKEGGQGMFHRRDGGFEFRGDGGQSRQIEIDADGGEDGQHPEQRDQLEALYAGDFGAGWGFGNGHEWGMGPGGQRMQGFVMDVPAWAPYFDRMPESNPRKTPPFAPFEWMIALRYLRGKRQESVLSIISILSLLGVMLGVAALIIVM